MVIVALIFFYLVCTIAGFYIALKFTDSKGIAFIAALVLGFTSLTPITAILIIVVAVLIYFSSNK